MSRRIRIALLAALALTIGIAAWPLLTSNEAESAEESEGLPALPPPSARRSTRCAIYSTRSSSRCSESLDCQPNPQASGRSARRSGLWVGS